MGRIYKRDDRWGIDYTDFRGRRVRKVVAADKTVALRLLADALEADEKVAAGIFVADPREARKPFEGHFGEYLADLERRGRDAMYVYNIRKHVEGAAEEQGWACLADCSVRSVSAYLQKLARRGLAPKTVNAHRSDLAAFFGWCVRHDLLEANPCDRVAKTTVKSEPTRRALSVAECRALLDATPEPRRLTYLFLVYTGVRRGEAEELVCGHVHLDVANPYLELPADITKSGKAESVPLVPELADALRARRGAAPDHEPLFDAIPSMDVFRADLAAAGIGEEDERGRKVVVHSLRHSLATMLAQSQVPPAIAQRVLRHRDIRLTMQAYTDDALLPVAAAMRTLPSLTGDADSLGFVGTNGAKNVPTSGLNGARRGTRATGASAAEAS